MKKLKILYAGDTGFLLVHELAGVEFVPFLEQYLETWKYLDKALKKDPEIDVTHLPAWAAYSEFPKTSEELNEFNVVILSDVGYDTLALYPALGEYKVPMGPNRLIGIKEYVKNGGGLAFCGGWYSFQGRYGHGKWYGSPVAEILPVEILPIHDDRVEAPEGLKPKVVNQNHYIMKDIPWDTCPPFVGYNKTGSLKEGSILLATIGDNDNLIAVREYANGRVMAFTSDPVLHWGTAFTKWEFYPKFWIQAVKWLAKKE